MYLYIAYVYTIYNYQKPRGIILEKWILENDFRKISDMCYFIVDIIHYPIYNQSDLLILKGDIIMKSKLTAGLLAIFLGGLGIHKFYLGYTKEGIIMLCVTLIVGSITLGTVSVGMGLVALIEGILYLTKSDDEFQMTYVDGHKGWF